MVFAVIRDAINRFYNLESFFLFVLSVILISTISLPLTYFVYGVFVYLIQAAIIIFFLFLATKIKNQNFYLTNIVSAYSFILFLSSAFIAVLKIISAFMPKTLLGNEIIFSIFGLLVLLMHFLLFVSFFFLVKKSVDAKPGTILIFSLLLWFGSLLLISLL